MKAYLLILSGIFLLSCGPKNFLEVEMQMHYMDVDSKNNIGFSFLTINFHYNTYILQAGNNYRLMGRWHLSDDTLVLVPQYNIVVDVEKDSIYMDDLLQKRNYRLEAKPVKCLFKGKDLCILPNEEPFIYEMKDGTSKIIPATNENSFYEEPTKFVLWRKTTRGDPFKYIRQNSRNE